MLPYWRICIPLLSGHAMATDQPRSRDHLHSDTDVGYLTSMPLPVNSPTEESPPRPPMPVLNTAVFVNLLSGFRCAAFSILDNVFSYIVLIFYRCYRHIFLLHIPACYNLRIVRWNDDPPTDDDNDQCRCRWNSYVQEYKVMGSTSIAISGLTVSMLQAIMTLPRANVAFDCAICGIVCSLIATALCQCFLLSLESIQDVACRRVWLQNSHTKGPVWRFSDPELFLAAPAAWTAWSTIMLISSIVSYLWLTLAATTESIGEPENLLLSPSLAEILTFSVLLGHGIVHLIVSVTQIRRLARPTPPV